MDAGVIVSSISNLGFPVIMCVLLVVYINNMQTGFVKELQALTKLVEKMYNEMIERGGTD